MASATTVSPSERIPSDEITSNEAPSHENCIPTIFHSDEHSNFEKNLLDENAKTVSEEEGSSPSAGGEDHENSSLGNTERTEQHFREGGPRDEEELLFLQEEEDKLMQQDENFLENPADVGVTSVTESQHPENSEKIPVINNSKDSHTITRANYLEKVNGVHQHLSNSKGGLQEAVAQSGEQQASGEAVSAPPVDQESSNKNPKRVTIVEVANPIKSSEDAESSEFSLKRSRIDSIDLDAHTFDFDGMGIGLSNAPGIIVDETKSSNLPPLENENNKGETKSENVQKNEEMMSTQRGRGYSLDFFAFGMNEDEPIPPTPISSADVEYHQACVDQSAGNTAISDFDAKLRPRGDSIIFDPSSFGDGGIHEANALERSRRPSISLDVDEMEIMNTPGFVEPQTHVPEICESQMPGMVTNEGSPVLETPNYQHPGAPAQSQVHTFTNPHIQARATNFAPTPLNNNLPQGSRTIPSLISMPSETILTPDAMSGSSGVLQIDQMELLNKGGRIGLYLPNARKERIAKFHSKRKMRIWRKRIKYDCRKKLADSRPRIKGRFVKRSDVDE